MTSNSDVLYKLDGCELMQEGLKLRFFYPDGAEEVVRVLVDLGETVEEDVTYYEIGTASGKNIRSVFKEHVRSSV